MAATNGTGKRSSGTGTGGPNTAYQVQVQTIRSNVGVEATFTAVLAAVKTYNSQQPKNAVPHTAVLAQPMGNNVKGLTATLALLATVARSQGATMVRLGVHGSAVALCGTKPAIEATQQAMANAYAHAKTTVDGLYNQTAHGSSVGYKNGFMCGYPAGLAQQVSSGPLLAYGMGFLYPYPITGGSAYAAGVLAGYAAPKPSSARPSSARPSSARRSTPTPSSATAPAVEPSSATAPAVEGATANVA